MYFVLAYNGAKIAKQCKHCTKLDLISDFYQTRFWAQAGPWKPNNNFISKLFLPKQRFKWLYSLEYCSYLNVLVHTRTIIILTLWLFTFSRNFYSETQCISAEQKNSNDLILF